MITKSALAYIPVNLANVIVSFGTIIILTRLFSAEEFGIYSLTMVTLLFVHMGLFAWLDATMARYHARFELDNTLNSFMKSIYAGGLISGAIGTLLILMFLYLLPLDGSIKLVLAFALSSMCLRIFSNLSMEAHMAAERIGRYSLIYTFQTLMAFVIGILLILYTPLRVEAPFIGIWIAYIISCGIDVPFMRRQMARGKVDPSYLKTGLIYGVPISISLLLTYTLNSADLYIISAFLGTEAAGQYNAGYNLANRPIDIIFIWIGMALTPIIIRATESDGVDNSKEILKSCGAAMLWVGLPAATGIALVAQPAGFILGESIRDKAVTVMPIIAFAAIMNGMITYYAHRAFMLSEKTNMFVWAMVPPVILNILLNIYLIPKYQLMGAVYATFLAYLLGLVITLWLGRKYYPLPLPIKAFFQISTACLIMAAIVHSLPIPLTWPDFIKLIVKGLVGAVSYILISLMINSANCRDWIKERLKDSSI